MKQKLEINLLSATSGSAKTFAGDLDQQIAELEENLHLLKLVRATVGRTFGLDRREGSFVEQLVDGAKRAETEISEEELERELRIGEEATGSTMVIVDPMKTRRVV